MLGLYATGLLWLHRDPLFASVKQSTQLMCSGKLWTLIIINLPWSIWLSLVLCRRFDQTSLSPLWLYSPYTVAVWDCRLFGVAVLTFAVLVCRRFDQAPCTLSMQLSSPRLVASPLCSIIISPLPYALLGCIAIHCVSKKRQWCSTL